MRYQAITPVKVGKPGRIIKPGDGPLTLTDRELSDAQGYVVEVVDDAAETKQSDSSGKGGEPGPKGSRESSAKNTDGSGDDPSGNAPAGGKPDEKDPGSNDPEGNGAASSGEGPVDLNAVTKDQLVKMGLTAKAAAAVVAHRKKLAKNGQRFESVDELTEVHGLGDKALEKLRDKLTVTEA